MAEENITEAEEKFFESGGTEPVEDTADVPLKGSEDSFEGSEVDGEQEPAEPQPAKTVPYAALHEERQRRKEAAEQAAQMRERMARMEAVFERFQQQQTPQEPEVTYDDDPAEYLRRQQARTGETLENISRRLAYEDQQRQHAAQINNLVSEYRSQAVEFKSQRPDFPAAYKHLLESRKAEYEAAGYQAHEVANFIQEDEIAIVNKARADGVNPAQRLYDLAKVRGYRAAASADAKIETIEKGQRAARTISGGRAQGRVSLETLAEMDGEEFDREWTKIFGNAKNIYG